MLLFVDGREFNERNKRYMEIKYKNGVPYREGFLSYLSKSIKSRNYSRHRIRIKICDKNMSFERFIEEFSRTFDFFATVFIVFKGIGGGTYLRPIDSLKINYEDIPIQSILFLFAVSPNNYSFRMWYKERNDDDIEHYNSVSAMGLKFIGV